MMLRLPVVSKSHWALRSLLRLWSLHRVAHPAARRRLKRRHYAPPLRRVVVRPLPQRLMRPVTVQTSRRGVPTCTTTPVPFYAITIDNFVGIIPCSN